MSNNKIDKEHAVFLSSDKVPTSWYNILPDLPDPLSLPVNPANYL